MDPKDTSKRCSRCGALNNHYGDYYQCPSCGLYIDRQLNAAINLYLNMQAYTEPATFEKITRDLKVTEIFFDKRTNEWKSRELNDVLKITTTSTQPPKGEGGKGLLTVDGGSYSSALRCWGERPLTGEEAYDKPPMNPEGAEAGESQGFN